jgi:asparagine synthase (glutamine-hydrolysing)
MCGIVGIIKWGSNAVDPHELQALNEAAIHRGPDELGSYIEGSVGLAMRRLSIIDLAMGSQPMFSQDRRYVIIFNGEIYNFKELRAALISEGAQFRTQSDTEVLLIAYQVWGRDMLRRLNGMWAFAIYDRVAGRLFLSRDRLGEKQIYYANTDRYFVFGSEMATPLGYSNGQRKLRLAALAEFLTYQYIGGNETAVEGINALLPAHWMEVSKEGSIQTGSYWDVSTCGSHHMPPASLAEATEEVYALLTDSVRLRMTADVPVSLMLSSGLDSSALAHILTAELDAPLVAVSAGYLDREFDESEEAGHLAGRFGLPWHQTLIHDRDIPPLFDDYMAHNSSLQSNTAAWVYYFACKRIRELGFKVALNGNGGDELFCGYPTLQADAVHRYYQFLPGSARRAVHSAAQLLPASLGRVSLDYKIKKFSECQYISPLLAHAYWRTVFSEESLNSVLSDQARNARPPFTITYDRAYEKLGHVTEPFRRNMIADFQAWLSPMLPWVDNISMAHSIELRLPFLDHRLIERMLSLPSDWLFRGWKLKRFMKRMLRGRLPDDVLNRRKRGTHLPISRWLEGDLAALGDRYLRGESLNREGLFNMRTVGALRDNHRHGRQDNTFKLWNLIVFAAWKERFQIGV